MADEHDDTTRTRPRLSDRSLIAVIALSLLGAAAFFFWPGGSSTDTSDSHAEEAYTADGGEHSTTDSRENGGSRAVVAPAGLPAVQQDLPKPVAAVHSGGDSPSSLQVAGRSIPIDTITTDAGGTLHPPQDITRVGWWVNSGLPGGGAGSVVVTGHINGTAGDGAAHTWTTARNGDEIVLVDAAGAKLRYTVTSNTQYNKTTAFPVDLVNKLDGPETLVLVTCGGEFVGGALGYQDNQIVTAVRIP
ncbi:sortase [Rhodococcus hoagii]|nr:sortase [Prescottella equi]NKS72246.1 sortase [Prescottella equi]